MLFAATAISLALVATTRAASFNAATLAQCASAQLSFSGSTAPYYVAVLPAANPCGSDALAEFHDVWDTSVSYYVNLSAGTQVQLYVLDANNVESFSQIETVGGGDGTCLGNGSNTNTGNTNPGTPYTPPANTNPGTTYTPPANTNNNAGSNTPPADTNNNAGSNTPPAAPADTGNPVYTETTGTTGNVDTNNVNDTPADTTPVDTTPQDAGSNPAPVPNSGSTLASSAAAGSSYAAPSNVASSHAASSSSASSSSNGAGNVAQAPVDSGSDTNGAASVTASVTLALGAFSALFALL